jgi:N-acetylmuramoyl-L-alanine amidase
LTTLGAMRLRVSLLITVLAGVILIVPATASAYFVHVVAPGETLSSIAATDGLTVAELAVANGLSPTAQLVAGSTLQIPPQQSGVTAPVAAATSAPSATTGDGDNDADDAGSSATTAGAPASTASAGAYVVQPGDTLSAIAARAGVSTASLAAANGLNANGVLVSGTVLHLSGNASAAPAGTVVPVSMTTAAPASYVVQPGDTLTAIAARAGISPASLAAANGLDANGVLVSGTVLHLSGRPASVASSSAAESQPVGAVAQGSPTDPPYPTPERVSAPEVGSIAAANGVPASLADAIAWQESGFNNDLVSSADARGVMQILPGTWQWIQQSLDTGAPLAPASAADNVRGGVLMLHSLLDATGGDPAMAAAGYFQGLPSVQQHGLYPETQQYVQSVLALERQFGGG